MPSHFSTLLPVPPNRRTNRPRSSLATPIPFVVDDDDDDDEYDQLDSSSSSPSPSSSPLSAAPSEHPHEPDYTGTATATATAAATPAEPTPVSTPTIHPQPPKKRRKTSPPPTATPFNGNGNASASASTPITASANHKSTKTKVIRPSTLSAPPTRSQKTFLVRDAHSHAQVSRAGSQHVVDDDTPLPVPPPRAGMGDGNFIETPKESALREEAVIRNEARFLIEAAEHHRVEREGREKTLQQQQQHVNGSLGRRTRKPVKYVYDDDEEMSDGDVFHQSGPTNTNSNRRRSTRNGDPGPSTAAAAAAAAHSAPSFEEQYAQVQSAFKASARQASEADRLLQAQSAAINDKRRQSLAVVNAARNPNPPRVPDQLERSYASGFTGLTNEMESDAEGFVENVKENLRSILEFYFVGSAPRRDAFCERIGRGLARLGWELTDNSELAVQR